MAQRSKFFRIALEGDTTDGRAITRQDIVDAADTFNPSMLGVRVNLEHFRGITPDGPFKMLGDVSAVKWQEDEVEEDGKKVKRAALYAQIEPTEQLIAINKDRQKIFTSMELRPNYRGTTKSYLAGLAVTDSPASFGSEALQFSSKSGLYDGRKAAKDALFACAHEVALELEGGSTVVPDDDTAFFSKMKAFFTGMAAPEGAAQSGTQETPAAPQSTPAQASDDPAAAAIQQFATQMATFTEQMGQQFASLEAKISANADGLSTLRSDLEKQPDTRRYTRRPEQSGGGEAKESQVVY